MQLFIATIIIAYVVASVKPIQLPSASLIFCNANISLTTAIFVMALLWCFHDCWKHLLSRFSFWLRVLFS